MVGAEDRHDSHEVLRGHGEQVHDHHSEQYKNTNGQRAHILLKFCFSPEFRRSAGGRVWRGVESGRGSESKMIYRTKLTDYLIVHVLRVAMFLR